MLVQRGNDKGQTERRICDGYGGGEGDGKTRTRSQDKGCEVLLINTTGEELKKRRDSISTVNTDSGSHLDAGDIDPDGHRKPLKARVRQLRVPPLLTLSTLSQNLVVPPHSPQAKL
ncbi:hypothetical protein ASPCAL05022 [Aspergillus calidoustus]|uniref:Uncharacterized protein n=1 Tax=Aspergillus calidoustus TaxID=454130 RepID=A0A0U5C6C9_ASPCI|nr:hypothetical protein ASPCAL05022 [Aspergillus calidoustus]